MGKTQSQNLERRANTIVDDGVPYNQKEALVNSLVIQVKTELIKKEKFELTKGKIGGLIGGTITGAVVGGGVALGVGLLLGGPIAWGTIAVAAGAAGIVGGISGTLLAKKLKVKGFWKGFGVGVGCGVVSGVLVGASVSLGFAGVGYLLKLNPIWLVNMKTFFSQFLPKYIIEHACKHGGNYVCSVGSIGLGPTLLLMIQRDVLSNEERRNIIINMYKVLVKLIKNDPDTPSYFVCPITQSLIVNPYTIVDYSTGSRVECTFEKDAICTWFRSEDQHGNEIIRTTHPINHTNFKKKNGEDITDVNLLEDMLNHDDRVEKAIRRKCSQALAAVFHGINRV